MRVSYLAERIGARAVAGSEVPVDSSIVGAAALDAARSGELSFFADARYREALLSTEASAVILDEETAGSLPDPRHALLIHSRPAVAFARALELLHPEPVLLPGVHPSAVVEGTALIDPSASVGALAYVGDGARVGARTRLLAGCHVGMRATIGDDCVVGPRAVVADGCSLGDRVRLQPGAVVGSDGFGYVLDRDESGASFHRKVPQVGIVRVEDDVEIGAGACVDRATTGETVVGRGAKIDNLVQVGHNSVIGPMSILCGQVGLAGSTRLGQGVVLAGQVGVAGHLTVGDNAKVGAQSGIASDVPAGAAVSGTPAVPHRTWLRASLVTRELPSLLRRIRALEKKLEE